MQMSIEEIMKELKEIKDNPGMALKEESELEIILKEIIKIERRHLYGLNSTSPASRKKAVQDFLTDKLKEKESSNVTN